MNHAWKHWLSELAWGSRKEEPFALRRLHAIEDGKISLSALFVALAFFVIIGFVGNAEMAVFRKLEAQNAADSMALTCATWRARGMNAVTANNHLMGELSAVAVLVEALGGPELDGQEESVKESEDMNDALNNPIAPGAPIKFNEFIAFVGSPFTLQLQRLDKQYVDFLQDTFTGDDGKHDALATIYDGQMEMKALVWYGFITKISSNAVYLVVSVVSFGIAAPAAEVANLSVHLAIDTALLTVVKDWYLTKGVAAFASLLQQVRKQVVPITLQALSMYGDSLADRTKVRGAIESSLRTSQQQFAIESFQTFPLVRDMRLPIEREPAPERAGGTATIPPSLSTAKPDESFVVEAIKGPLRGIQGTIDFINDLVPPFLPNPIDFDISPVSGKDYRELTQDEGGGFGFPGNPSLKNLKELAQKEQFDWREDRSSQWVRATYPHVDELRRSLREFFNEVIPSSLMGSFYVHWTNRYCISVSHKLRTEDSDNHLYFLTESTAEGKGNEPWTNNPQRAEQLFATQVFIKLRTPPAILTPPLFPNPNRKGVLAISESLTYNANGRRINGPTSPPRERQPDTGWDTLNWLPPVNAPEWGAPESSPRDMDRARSLFFTGPPLQADARSRMQLNWQSKLSPFGESRLREALAVPEISKFFGPAGSSLLPDASFVLH